MFPLIALMATALVPLSNAQTAGEPTVVESQRLVRGKEIEREISRTSAHIYDLEVSAGDCAQIVVEQEGADVVIDVSGVGGKTVTEIDRPNGSVGRETVTFVAPETGDYKITVRPAASLTVTDKYSILLKDISPVSDVDRLQIAAEKLTTDGEALRFNGEIKFDEKSLDDADENFRQALVIWQKLNDPYEQAVVYYGLGWSHIPKAEYTEATLYFARGLKIDQKINDEYGQTINFAGIGWSEFYSGNFELAEFNFENARRIAERNGYKSQIAKSLFGLGNVANMLGESAKATVLLTDSIAIRREINERRQEALGYITLSKVALKQNNTALAFHYLNEATIIFRDVRNKKGSAEISIMLGWTYYSTGNNQAALKNFEEALRIGKLENDIAGEAATCRGLSLVYFKLGNFPKAEEHVRRVFEILDSLRGRLLNQDSRISLLGSFQDYFEDGIKVFAKMHQAMPGAGYDKAAFELSDRSRSRTLFESISARRSAGRHKIEPALLARKQETLQALQDAMAAYKSEKKDDPKSLGQQLSIQHLLFSSREIDGEMGKTKSPETIPADTSSLAEIQKYLNSDTVLLEYYLGSEESWVWSVTRAKVSVFRLPPRKIIEDLANEVRAALLLGKTDPAASERIFKQKGAKLSAMILAPVLTGPGHQKLLIVPGGALQYVPFAALPKDTRPLVDDHEISYLPSSSMLPLLSESKTPRYEKELAIFADPVFSVLDVRIKNPRAVRPADGGVNRLFSSRFEAEMIAGLLRPDQSRIFLDFDANRERVLKEDLRAYRILHFATHSSIDEEQPDMSAVMLSNFDKDGNPVKGLLRSGEILNLDLQAETVVLSGCQTGLGKNVRGEGLLGLSRTFLMAGTSHLLVSLWEVEDKAAAELMVRFYRHYLNEKLSPAESLRIAQIEISKDKRWRSPFYWSAFVLQGNV